jgi:hypothetical protein
MKKITVLMVLCACLLFMPMLLMAQLNIPTATPDPEMTAEITPEATEAVMTIIIEASEGQAIDPPITIELPPGWISQNATIAIQDITGIQVLPYTLYAGFLGNTAEDGIGYIVLLWGFPSIGFANEFMQAQDVVISPFMDGLRLLRIALLEPDCNVGTDIEREFPIGDKIGSGTGFAAINCPNTPDTRGWFVSLYEDGMNFAFYIYAEPIDKMDGAEDDLQAILDTVRFDVQGFLERASAEQTPQAEWTAEATPTP